jgi:hypothetical protein
LTSPIRARLHSVLADRTGAVGYPLKDRVLDVGQFVATVRQVAAGEPFGLEQSEEDNRRVLALLVSLEG